MEEDEYMRRCADRPEAVSQPETEAGIATLLQLIPTGVSEWYDVKWQQPEEQRNKFACFPVFRPTT